MKEEDSTFLIMWQPSSKPFRRETYLQTVRLKKTHTNSEKATYAELVIFSDAVSVLQALQNLKNKEMDMLASSLATLQQSTERTVIQWILTHCNIPGNEEADRPAKDGWRLP